MTTLAEEAERATFEQRYRAAVQDNVRLVALVDESRANLATAASVARHLSEKLEQTKTERDQVAVLCREAQARCDELLAIAGMPGPDQVVLPRADYERLIASLPATSPRLRVVPKPDEP